MLQWGALVFELCQQAQHAVRRSLTKAPARILSFLFFFTVILAGAYLFTRLRQPVTMWEHAQGGIPAIPSRRIEFPLDCHRRNTTHLAVLCPTGYYPSNFEPDEVEAESPSPGACPDYFRWIHEDLRPWKDTGITLEMVERARRTATFRLVVVNGRAYVERYNKAFQTRDEFTLWGFLQLLRRYPGRIPDLDLMFDCVDWPVVEAKQYGGRDAPPPPPLFRYCGDEATLDIVFPDWSFWGWPEINISPWQSLLNNLKEGNRKQPWMSREPFAFWKGNPAVAATRQDLMKCNLSDNRDWNARLFSQDWIRESQQGYQHSDLTNQCTYRYKIYIEGSAWSVSEKYILACDSMTLVVRPKYYDFFSRGLMPVRHYWPIRDDDKCRSIKFAVDWGNSHKSTAREMGREASKFVQEEVKMESVYDYMLHLLTEYSKLLRYKPTVPQEATELCSESMACSAQGVERSFKMESLLKGPALGHSCSMPPPYEPTTLHTLLTRKENFIKQVEIWENGATP